MFVVLPLHRPRIEYIEYMPASLQLAMTSAVVHCDFTTQVRLKWSLLGGIRADPKAVCCTLVQLSKHYSTVREVCCDTRRQIADNNSHVSGVGSFILMIPRYWCILFMCARTLSCVHNSVQCSSYANWRETLSIERNGRETGLDLGWTEGDCLSVGFFFEHVIVCKSSRALACSLMVLCCIMPPPFIQ